MKIPLDQAERGVYEFLKIHPNGSLDEIHGNLHLDKRRIRKALDAMERNGILSSSLRWESKRNEAVNIYIIKEEV